jgi:hypothetical protein
LRTACKFNVQGDHIIVYNASEYVHEFVVHCSAVQTMQTSRCALASFVMNIVVLARSTHFKIIARCMSHDDSFAFLSLTSGCPAKNSLSCDYRSLLLLLVTQ